MRCGKCVEETGGICQAICEMEAENKLATRWKKWDRRRGEKKFEKN